MSGTAAGEAEIEGRGGAWADGDSKRPLVAFMECRTRILVIVVVGVGPKNGGGAIANDLKAIAVACAWLVGGFPGRMVPKLAEG